MRGFGALMRMGLEGCDVVGRKRDVYLGSVILLKSVMLLGSVSHGTVCSAHADLIGVETALSVMRATYWLLYFELQ